MPASLTLADFSDFDLLYALEDSYDEDGWTTAQDVAEAIGIDHAHPAKCVGSRLAWLNRYGIMDQNQDSGQMLWRLNEKGETLLHPDRLPAAVQRALDTLDEGQRVSVTDAIARALPGSSREAAHLSRRAWQHNFGGWRDPRITPKRKAGVRG